MAEHHRFDFDAFDEKLAQVLHDEEIVLESLKMALGVDYEASVTE